MTPRLNELKPYAHDPCRNFCFPCFCQSVLFDAFTWIVKDSDATDPRKRLLELFQSLADQVEADAGHSRDVSARAREAGDEPALDRISHSYKDDGDGPSCLLGG